MKTTKKIIGNYTPFSDDLMSIPSLPFYQKTIISYVLRWQMAEKVCFVSNKSLSNKFCFSESSVTRSISALSKLPFFTVTYKSYYNEFGTWVNSRVMEVDELKFAEYLKNHKNGDTELVADENDEEETVPTTLLEHNIPETIQPDEPVPSTPPESTTEEIAEMLWNKVPPAMPEENKILTLGHLFKELRLDKDAGDKVLDIIDKKIFDDSQKRAA